MNACGEITHGSAELSSTMECCHCSKRIGALEAHQFVWPSKATCFGLCLGCYNLLCAGHGVGVNHA